MAEPNDSAFTLQDATAIFQTQYYPQYLEQYPAYMHQTTNRLFKMKTRKVEGSGITVQYELGPADNVRVDSNPLGAFAPPTGFDSGNFTIRFNETTPASSDFSHISCSVQVTDLDVENAAGGTIINLVKRLQSQVMPNYDFALAVKRNTSRTATLGTVSGTPTLGTNQWYYNSSAGAASNSGGIRFVLSGGSIANLRRNSRISFLNASTFAAIVNNVRVLDVNPSDNSIRCEFVSSGVPGTLSSNGTGTLASVASTNIVVLSNAGSNSNEYGNGMWSVGAYMTTPTSGESFLGGVDRTTGSYAWMLPTFTRANASSNAKITKSMFNDQANAMSFRVDGQRGGIVFQMEPYLHQAVRDEVTEAALIPWTQVDESAKERFGSFGTMGLNYQHGQFGIVQLVSDPLAAPNTVRILDTSTWESLYWGFQGLKNMPGTKGNWYRVTETTPNTGDGKVWKTDFYAIQCDWCSAPWKNGAILNVSPT